MEMEGDMDIDVLRTLLSFQDSASHVNRIGQNLGHFHNRGWKMDVRVLQVMNEYGVDLAKDDEGRTMLRIAAARGSMTQESREFLIGTIGLGLGEEDK